MGHRSYEKYDAVGKHGHACTAQPSQIVFVIVLGQKLWPISPAAPGPAAPWPAALHFSLDSYRAVLHVV